MANFRLYYFSETLRMKVGVNVIIPENTWGHSLADRPKGYKYPVLWLQSGGGFDYTDWQRYTALELYAAEAGVRLCAVALTVPGIWIQSMGILNILHSCQSRHQIW